MGRAGGCPGGKPTPSLQLQGCPALRALRADAGRRLCWGGEARFSREVNTVEPQWCMRRLSCVHPGPCQGLGTREEQEVGALEAIPALTHGHLRPQGQPGC